MPELDRSGPQGKGSMTGRRMGRCTNFGSIFKKRSTPSEGQNENLPQERKGKGLGFFRGWKKGGAGRGKQNRARSGSST